MSYWINLHHHFICENFHTYPNSIGHLPCKPVCSSAQMGGAEEKIQTASIQTNTPTKSKRMYIDFPYPGASGNKMADDLDVSALRGVAQWAHAVVTCQVDDAVELEQ